MMENKKLTEQFVEEQLAEWAQEDYPLTVYQEQQAKEMFYKLMNEKQNSSKTLLVQEALLAEIARKLSYGETPDGVFRQHSDNRHMNYFDVFLEDGQSTKILEALEINGIPTDVLKGIKKGVPFHVIKDGVEVEQRLDDGDDGTPHVDYFEIKVDGKTIYKWTPTYDFDYYDNADIDTPKEEKRMTVTPRTKSGNPILYTIHTPERSVVVSQATRKNGKKVTIAQDSKTGRFVSLK